MKTSETGNKMEEKKTPMYKYLIAIIGGFGGIIAVLFIIGNFPNLLDLLSFKKPDFEVEKYRTKGSVFLPSAYWISIINRSEVDCTGARIILNKYYSADLKQTTAGPTIDAENNSHRIMKGNKVVILDKNSMNRNFDSDFSDSNQRRLNVSEANEISIECEEGKWHGYL